MIATSPLSPPLSNMSYRISLRFLCLQLLKVKNTLIPLNQENSGITNTTMPTIFFRFRPTVLSYSFWLTLIRKLKENHNLISSAPSIPTFLCWPCKLKSPYKSTYFTLWFVQVCNEASVIIVKWGFHHIIQR